MSDDSTSDLPEIEGLIQCAGLAIERDAAAVAGEPTKAALVRGEFDRLGCARFEQGGALEQAFRLELARQLRMRFCAGLLAEAHRESLSLEVRRYLYKVFQSHCKGLAGSPEFNGAVEEGEARLAVIDELARIEREASEAAAAPAELTEDAIADDMAEPPPILETSDVVAAYRREPPVVPLARIHRFIAEAGVDWASDVQDAGKAYIMACFSELAYLHLTEHELAERDRYKLFRPSQALEELAARGFRIDIAATFGQVAELEIRVFETIGFVYVVLRVRDITVVAVRGTVSRGDLRLDLNALKNPAVHGFYHRGFHDEAIAARPLIESVVDPGTKLYFTGHSLGAAVAAILSQIWPVRGAVMTPYLFAPPRFGTRAAAARLRRFAYTRRRDVVPHLPPKFLGFSDEGAIVTMLPGIDPAEVGLRGLWRVVANAHFMEGHRRLLGEAVGERYPEHIYIDLLIWKLKELQKHR